jgi:hypothetical protein
MRIKIIGIVHEDIRIFMTSLVSNFTIVVFVNDVTSVYVLLWLPATIVVMFSNVTIDFIIILVTLATRLTSVHWFQWLREAPEVFRSVDIFYFVTYTKADLCGLNCKV